MPVAEARAIDQRLVVQEEDPEQDVKALSRLAQWLERYSPYVGLEEGPAPESLLLDVSGCGPFFRGEDRLLQRGLRELKEEGWSARLAIADTTGAAWGLAHFADTPFLALPGEADKVLPPLPVAALRLPADTLTALASLGAERIHQVLAWPRSSIPVRFGSAVLQRLDQAFGRLPEVLVPHRVPANVQASCVLAFPTDRIEILFRILEPLAEQIHKALGKRNQGARQVECWLYPEAVAPLRLEVVLFRPSRSPHHLGKLLRTRLEQVRVPDPVGAVCLRVSAADPVIDRQADMFGGVQSEELPFLIDLLSSRLGREAVARATLVPDFQPEYACCFEPVIRKEADDRGRRKRSAVNSSAASDGRALFPRPLQLQSPASPIEVLALTPDGPPLRFRWEGVDYRVIRAWGPERIETGWWRGHDIQRDYYVAATDRGNRFWLFRRHDDGRWFLHGCFD
jgi:protein ImuB